MAAGILQLMQLYHYSRVSVDDELSEPIFDRYLDSLDPQKSFFLASDMEECDDFRQIINEALKTACLRSVFDIFKRLRVRVEERAEFAAKLLKNEFDFTIDESYTYNREDEAWPQSQKAWPTRIKNDVRNLRLADQINEELVETLEGQDPVSPEGQGFTGVSDSPPWSMRAAARGLLATSRATGARLRMVD